MTDPANTVNAKLGILDFDKMKELLGEVPAIYAMDYSYFRFKVSEYLANNTIIISKDLAIKLELWKDD